MGSVRIILGVMTLDMDRKEARFRAERALLVGVELAGMTELDSDLSELESLAESAGAIVVGSCSQRRRMPSPSMFVGTGKAEEIKELADELEADVVIFDDDLSPAQLRNLEKVSDRRVLDRSELIMDIFASRARTSQAKLQVELAQLEYALPRLRRMWSHLSRIEGGIGTRGPGEKQLETDRRLIQSRITELKDRLMKIRRRRERQVESRGNAFTVSLVGYTNVGKSTLLNRVTEGGAVVADRLFMTLDTCSREWDLGDGLKTILSDTVGFIRKLPHHLISSFHATLEEARHADLLLHVIDASHPNLTEQVEAVDRVMKDLGVGDRPCIQVLNKVDQLPDGEHLDDLLTRYPETIPVSAQTGKGLGELKEAVRSRVLERYVQAEFLVEPGNGKLFSFLHNRGVITASSTEEDGKAFFRVMLSPADLAAANRLVG